MVVVPVLSFNLLLFGIGTFPPRFPHIRNGKTCPYVDPVKQFNIKMFARNGPWYVNQVSGSPRFLRKYSCMSVDFDYEPDDNTLHMMFTGNTRPQNRVDKAEIEFAVPRRNKNPIYHTNFNISSTKYKASTVVFFHDSTYDHVILLTCIAFPKKKIHSKGAMILSKKPYLPENVLQLQRDFLNRHLENPVSFLFTFKNTRCKHVERKINREKSRRESQTRAKDNEKGKLKEMPAKVKIAKTKQ